MTDQALAEFLSNGLLGACLVAVVTYFLREVKTIRTERDAAQGEVRELEKAIRTEIIPTMTRMMDTTQACDKVIAEVRADLKAERNRGA